MPSTDVMACGCPRSGHLEPCPWRDASLQEQLAGSLRAPPVPGARYLGMLADVELWGVVDMVKTERAAAQDQSDIARMRRRRAGRCPTHDLEPERWGAGANAETMQCYQIYRCPSAGCDYEVMR